GCSLLGKNFWNQLSHGRCHRDSHGISVRHQLVALRSPHWGSDRPAAGDGRRVLVFSGICIFGTVSLWRKAFGTERTLVGSVPRLSWLVAVRVFHHRY